MDIENHLEKFDYSVRQEMNIHIPELLELLKNGNAKFIDVRFKRRI